MILGNVIISYAFGVFIGWLCWGTRAGSSGARGP